MKYLIMAIMATGLSIAATVAVAQSSVPVSGIVQDPSGKPLPAVTVRLMAANEKTFSKVMVTDSAGHYLFENVPAGAYTMLTGSAGYKDNHADKIIIGDQPVQLPVIVLLPDAVALQNVTIVSKRPPVEHKIDRTIVNVDAMISNAGTTALDVLEKAPGVLVEPDGSISMKGKTGTVVFIDDKPSYLSGSDLQNYLRSLPASAIDQVEIITNPPAKYDAAGNSGIINIKMKKSVLKGFNGNFSLNYNQGKYARSNNSLNFNYRKNKFNAFVNFSFGKLNGFSDLYISRRYRNADETTRSYFMQNTYIRRKGEAYNTRAGIDFYQSDKTTLGIVFTGQQRPGRSTKDNTSNLLNAAGATDSILKALNIEKGKFNNLGINTNYRHLFNKNGHELTADLDYIRYNTNLDQQFYNSSYLPDGTLKTKDQLTGSLPATLDIFSFKTDYSITLKGDYKFAAGLKTSLTNTDNTADYSNTINNITSPDYDKSNRFVYREQINAGYVNLNKDYKRFSVQAGLRLEHTLSKGHQLGNILKPDSAFRWAYTNLFPTFYLSYKVDSAGDNQLGLNYGYRIERPYYQDLNPFLSPLDKFTYYLGNPFLKPSFTSSIELSHTYKNRIVTTLSYSKTRNTVDETIEIVNGIYYSRPGNIGSIVTKSISVDASQDITKWFSAHVYTELTNIHSRGALYTGTLDSKGTFWFVKPDVQLKFKKDWTVEANLMFRTDIVNAQFVSNGYYRAGAGVQKKLSKAANLKFSINDIFYSERNNGVINNLAHTDASFHNRRDSQQFILTFSYRFGKAIDNLRRHETNGAETEQNRVKN